MTVLWKACSEQFVGEDEHGNVNYISRELAMEMRGEQSARFATNAAKVVDLMIDGEYPIDSDYWSEQ